VRVTGDPDDPKRSPRVSAEWAREQIAKWGRDNPWVMCNILGEFPPNASDQLISVDVVQACMSRDIPALAYIDSAIVWGLDPSRFGDDEAVLFKRQGVLARRPIVWRNLDGNQLGEQVARRISEAEAAGELPDILFIDVGGVGASVVDRLRILGYEGLVVPVDFAGTPDDPKYLNKRAEIWGRMAEWAKQGTGCLPNDVLLQEELIAPTFWFRDSGRQTKFVLESKSDMKDRGVRSPNRADALALTFTGSVAARSTLSRNAIYGRAHRAATESDDKMYAHPGGVQ
jgi:hypothetical protein